MEYTEKEVVEDGKTYIIREYESGSYAKWLKPSKNIDPEPPDPSNEPTNQDIMDMLLAMQGDQIPTATLDAAYREGVNSYE